MGDTQTEEIPDTASPYTPVPSTFSGWGRLLPLNCTLPAQDLVNNSYSIGREKRCEVSLTAYDIKPDVHKQISKVHCRISRRKLQSSEKEVVILEDLSSNGTFLNGEKIGKSNHRIVGNDDEISFAAPQNKIFMYVDATKFDFIFPREITDKYQIIQHIGTGGFAEVNLVLNKKTCEEFAMKKIKKENVSEKKIFNEINILKKLKHKCIVEMMEVIQTNEAAFIIMEYVRNGTLLDHVKKEKRLKEDTCKLILFQLGWAIQYLHQQGVTHRDIKPENILLEERPGELLVAKIADFGLSKIISSMTNLRTPCGTFQYTAPEVLIGRGIGEYSNKVDMWSIGVVLYICLSGRRPFVAKDGEPAQLMRLITRGSYSSSGPLWADISSTAKSVVKGLLTVAPSARFGSSDLLKHRWFEDPQLAKDLLLLFGSETPLKPDQENLENIEPPLKVARLEIF